MSADRSRIGRHLPVADGLEKTLEKAESLGCETVQIFVSNPRSWSTPPEREDGEAFAEGARKLGISPVVAHARYLINLASQKEEQRERSVRALAEEVVLAGSVGVDLVVVHCGSHGGDGEEKGMERLVAGLEQAREMAEARADGSRPAEVVIENSVGGGTQLCSSFEALAEAASGAGVRVCVDTAHAFAAGYDVAGDPSGVAEELRGALGSGVALLHLNDAKNELGGRRDGHARIGEGRIPVESWPELFAGLGGVPVVMETPYDTPEVDAEQVRLVKELASRLPNQARGI